MFFMAILATVYLAGWLFAFFSLLSTSGALRKDPIEKYVAVFFVGFGRFLLADHTRRNRCGCDLATSGDEKSP